MKNRKTVEIEFIKEKINKAIANNEFPLNYEQLEALTSFIEIVLYKTNSYKGFIFLDNNDTKIFTIGYLKRKYF